MREILHNILLFLALTKPRGMLCPNGTVKPFLVSLVEPVAYLKSELSMDCRMTHKSCAKTARRTRWTDLWYWTAEHASTMLSTARNVATSATERFITKSFEEALLYTLK